MVLAAARQTGNFVPAMFAASKKILLKSLVLAFLYFHLARRLSALKQQYLR
jgi:hypothetical protein